MKLTLAIRMVRQRKLAARDVNARSCMMLASGTSLKELFIIIKSPEISGLFINSNDACAEHQLSERSIGSASLCIAASST